MIYDRKEKKFRDIKDFFSTVQDCSLNRKESGFDRMNKFLNDILKMIY